MDSLKQKLSKTFSGGDEKLNEGAVAYSNPLYDVSHSDGSASDKCTVSYKNFDNPHFELSDSEGGSVSMNATGSGEYMFKSPNKRKYMIIIGTAIVVVLLILIVGIAVGVTASKDEKNSTKKPVTGRAGLLTTTVKPIEQSVSGSIRLLNMQWSPHLDDPYHEQYMDTERTFIDTMTDVIKTDSQYRNDDVVVHVTDFKQGSVVVDFRVTITSSQPVTPELVENTIKQSISKNEGQFGTEAVDPNSISVTPDVKATTVTAKTPTTATVKHLSNTVSTMKIRTTTTPTSIGSTTVPSSVGSSTVRTTVGTSTVRTTVGTSPPTSPPIETCSVRVHEQCRHVLPYNTTTRNLQMQNLLLNDTITIANRLAMCISDPNLVQFMLCSYAAPECRVSPGGSIRSPVLPCRHMCMNVYNQCKDVLRNTNYLQTVFNCDGYLPYPMRCNYVGPPPTTELTTRPTTLQRCYPLHHTYCQNIPYNSTYLPNYFGHTTLIDAYSYLGFLQSVTDNGIYCHQHIHALYCSLLLPKCDENYNRVPPCKSVCRDVNDRCMFLLASLPINLNVDCERFPTENCVGISNSSINTTSGCNKTTQYTCTNGQCIPLEQRCDGFHSCTDLSDEHACSGTEACTDGKHRCTHSGRCIPPDWVCDSFNDCGDSSDEANCVCNATEHHVCTTVAGHNKCLAAANRCDGFPNCFNATDEANCEDHVCRDDQFTCANGKCRPLRFVCDDDDDCGDNSDERDCTCPVDEFKCVNGTKIWGSAFVQTPCIPKLWRCDFQRDCTDGSDEIDCPSVCASNPCKHGGTCIGDANDLGFRCLCPEKTAGQFCQDVLELPDISCYNDITINSCKSVLAPYHNYTFSTPYSQSQVSYLMNTLLPRLPSCYEHAKLFVCQYVLPDCGAYGFINQPCKKMCVEFKHQCSHILDAVPGLSDVFNCDTLMDNTAFPNSQCFSLNHTQPTQVPPEPFQPVCEPLKSEYCKQLNWTTTYLPNYLNMTDQAAADVYLSQFAYAHTEVPACHRDLQKLGCSLLSPQCNSDSTGPLPPCRQLCEMVEQDCGYWLNHMQWNFPFNCSMFPNSTDPTVCVQLTPITPIEGCGLDQFECGSGECLHIKFTCDGTPDCQDGSDEGQQLCGSLTCPPVYYDCQDGYNCIPHAYVCDAEFDCPVDNRTGVSIDETNCVCDLNQFACLNGVGCVRAEYECDGITDCTDGSDESNCEDGVACPTNYELCLNEPKCIPDHWLCDNYPDCVGGTDELNCSGCSGNGFECVDGINKYSPSTSCISPDWICDQAEDCTDGSDEAGCFPCDNNPCLNGGTCVEGEPDTKTYTCQCPPSTNGTNCQIASSMETARCNKEIALNQCKSVLSPFYNTTRVDIQLQAVIGRHLTVDLLTRFDNCSASARLFLCGSELPGCRNNGLPILPCKHACTKFSQECRNQIRDTGLTFNCDHFPDTSIYPHAQCMYEPNSLLPPLGPNVNSTQCQDMKHQWCQKLGYNKTKIPNLVSLTSQAESEVYLNIFENLYSLDARCHDALQLFSCSVLAPNCTDKLPCQELCVEVTARCSYLLQAVGFPLSLNCSEFPNYVKNEAKCIIHDTMVLDCLDNEFTCAPGFCVPMSDRCDLWPDCHNGADELNCASNECANDDFFCRSNGNCIPSHWECDDYNDCPGGEDELNCFGCQSSEFACADNRTCYTRYEKCDLEEKCPGGDDEADCNGPCDIDQFMCNSGMCIPLLYKCDEYFDCPGSDGEDEQDCGPGNSCEDNQFKCENGVNKYYQVSRCVPIHWKCDDSFDCTDSSDERNCSACDESLCQHGGTCVENGQSYSCQCSPRFTGQYCQFDVLEEYSCNHSISIEECGNLLPYNNTSSAPHIQDILSVSTRSILNRLNETACYDMSSLFVCSSRFPACQANGLPLLPCRHVCESFLEKCRNLLSDDGATDLLQINCDAYPDYSTTSFRCLSGTDVPNPVGGVTMPPRTCEQIDNRFCSILGYSRVSLPNHFQQSRQDEAALVLNLVDGLSSNSTCRQLLHTFMCSLALPACGTDNISPIPPCKALCNDVLDDCYYWLNHYQFNLTFSCEGLPDSDNPDICMKRPETHVIPNSECAVNESKCLIGGCFQSNKTCDYICDCSDCSDEEGCFKQCPEERLRCPNQYDKCIRTTWVCDGYYDCADGFDEKDCETINENCTAVQFTCPATARHGAHCISHTWTCDGEIDCLGTEADEENCTCTDSQFLCDRSRCVPDFWRCDGYTDCDDDSDEVGCGDESTTSSPEDGCFEFYHPFCANILNRTTTHLPNVFGHTTKAGLESDTAVFNVAPCSDLTNHFLCASLFPKCGQFGPVFPCAGLCEQAVNGTCGLRIGQLLQNTPCNAIFESSTCVSYP